MMYDGRCKVTSSSSCHATCKKKLNIAWEPLQQGVRCEMHPLRCTSDPRYTHPKQAPIPISRVACHTRSHTMTIQSANTSNNPGHFTSDPISRHPVTSSHVTLAFPGTFSFPCYLRHEAPPAADTCPCPQRPPQRPGQNQLCLPLSMSLFSSRGCSLRYSILLVCNIYSHSLQYPSYRAPATHYGQSGRSVQPISFTVTFACVSSSPSPLPKDMQCVENCSDPNPKNHILYEQPVWQTLQMFRMSSSPNHLFHI